MDYSVTQLLNAQGFGYDHDKDVVYIFKDSRASPYWTLRKDIVQNVISSLSHEHIHRVLQIIEDIETSQLFDVIKGLNHNAYDLDHHIYEKPESYHGIAGLEL